MSETLCVELVIGASLEGADVAEREIEIEGETAILSLAKA
jgi:hypothetical protein